MMKLNKAVFAGNPDTPFSGAQQQELGESKRPKKTTHICHRSPRKELGQSRKPEKAPNGGAKNLNLHNLKSPHWW